MTTTSITSFKEEKMKTTKITLAAALIASLTVGATGAYAYYSAKTDTVTNSYNIVAGGGQNGSSAGTVEEVFKPETAKDLGPRATFDKDVKIKSKLDYSAYAYLCVTVPTINARLGSETSKTVRESVTLNFDNNSWTLVKHTNGSSSSAGKYLYRCKTILPSKGTTPSLFTKVSVPDYVEADAMSGSIDITGYMISSVNVSTTDSDADAVAKFFT